MLRRIAIIIAASVPLGFYRFGLMVWPEAAVATGVAGLSRSRGNGAPHAAGSTQRKWRGVLRASKAAAMTQPM
jgi:hypothetical protein